MELFVLFQTDYINYVVADIPGVIWHCADEVYLHFIVYTHGTFYLLFHVNII